MLPEKVQRDGVIEYECPPRDNMNFIMKFYTVNPDLRPNPTYTDLMGIQNTNSETIELVDLYDPFNIDRTVSIRFLPWKEVTPNTIPLYISTNGNNLYISPEKTIPQNYKPYKIPMIYVLTDAIFPKENGIPVFTFSNSYGKCMPDPQGSLSIGECIVLYNANITRPEYIGKYPSILNYIKVKYGNNNNKTTNVIGIIFASIFVISILVLFWIK